MKEVLPQLQRVAVLWNPENPAVAGEVEQLRTAARSLGLEVSAFPGTPQEIDDSFNAIAGGAFDGLVVTTDPSLEPLTSRVIAFAAERRLPTMYPFSSAVQNGGLMSYSIDFFDMWRRAAGYVDRILKGASPADLPIEQATRVALKINIKTAASLGLTIPPTLLARADEAQRPAARQDKTVGRTELPHHQQKHPANRAVPFYCRWWVGSLYEQLEGV
jgi:putative tryptophan/tyrosine transport system substrate-binding protein